MKSELVETYCYVVESAYVRLNGYVGLTVVKFLGSPKLSKDFWVCGVDTPNPHIVLASINCNDLFPYVILAN